jgi:hypothetical protein
MNIAFRFFLFLFLLLPCENYILSQKKDSFSGELVYSIERVDKKDSIKAEMIIYARDSMLRIVNFNSETGKQELIKHLRFNKSYLLIETPDQKFAVRTNEHLEKDTVVRYSFKKKFGWKRIAGYRAKKLMVTQKNIKNELKFYYFKNISAKYANSFKEFPGLPVLYYISTDHGVYKYMLKEIKFAVPPMQLFSFGKEYKIVTFEQFTEEFSRLYETGEK